MTSPTIIHGEPHFNRAEHDDRYGVVMVGIAQTSAWRGWRDGGPDGHPHFVYRRQSIFPNNYYFYIRDPDWGPAVHPKTVAYAPFPVWIYLNGNEWAKQQAARQGIAFRALDNGFASCEDPQALAGICHSLSAEDSPVLRALAGRAALAAERRGPPTRVRACARVPAARDLRHEGVRSAGRRARLV